GRNGGFVLTWWAKFGTLKKICGGDEAVRLARASAQAVDGIGAFCAENGIDAHYRRDGWLWAATSEAQLGAWEETLATIAPYGEDPFEPLGPGEAARRAGELTHLGGVFEPTAATTPAPERLETIGWTDGMCISDSRMLVNYYRNTFDGRLVFGRGGGKLAFGGKVGTAFDGPSPRAAAVTASMRGLYPSFDDVPVTHSWTGPVDRTPVGLPFFSRLGGREEILYTVGYSGNGVGPAYVGGRIVASVPPGLRT